MKNVGKYPLLRRMLPWFEVYKHQNQRRHSIMWHRHNPLTNDGSWSFGKIRCWRQNIQRLHKKHPWSQKKQNIMIIIKVVMYKNHQKSPFFSMHPVFSRPQGFFPMFLPMSALPILWSQGATWRRFKGCDACDVSSTWQASSPGVDDVRWGFWFPSKGLLRVKFVDAKNPPGCHFKTRWIYNYIYISRLSNKDSNACLHPQGDEVSRCFSSHSGWGFVHQAEPSFTFKKNSLKPRGQKHSKIALMEEIHWKVNEW